MQIHEIFQNKLERMQTLFLSEQNKQTNVECEFVLLSKQTSLLSSSVSDDNLNGDGADEVFSLPPWVAVLDHDILEHFDTVQVSPKISRSTFIKQLLVKRSSFTF